jgi:predicted amidohydrolase YtcJ
MTVIYQARKIVTMNPSRPLATHVAVRDGRILGAGSLDELTGWSEHQLDRSFADKVLMPGLVEGHSHVAEGVQWRFVYCGYFDRTDPDGVIWPGVKSIEEVLARLSKANAALSDPKQPLTGWALDPIYFDNQRMTRQDRPRHVHAADRHHARQRPHHERQHQGAGIGRHAAFRRQSSRRSARA